MTKRSAGILLYRCRGSSLELLLVHPGGPFWAEKDQGAWSIPKGEFDDGEIPLAVARREFEEELGQPAPAGEIIELGELAQPSRKIVTAFAIEGDFDPATFRSDTFELEWPPKSRRIQAFPEIDRADWFTPDAARAKNPARTKSLHRPAAGAACRGRHAGRQCQGMTGIRPFQSNLRRLQLAPRGLPLYHPDCPSIPAKGFHTGCSTRKDWT